MNKLVYFAVQFKQNQNNQDMKSTITNLLGVLFLFFISTSSYAINYTVNNSLDSGPGSLRQAIIDANNNPGNDEILISSNVSLNSSLPEITDNVIIHGNNYTVNGNAVSRAIYVNSNITLEINELIFINCFSDKGGAIRTNSGTTTINDCHFEAVSC